MIVAFAGQAGAGKSRAAARLVQTHGFREVSFAAPIKRVVGELFRFDTESLYGPSEARSRPHPTLRMPDGSPLTARIALQVVGTDLARTLCPDIWVDAAMRDIRDDEDVVLADCRYANEVAAIRARGGYVVRRRSDTPLTDMHPSEREMASIPDSYFDAVIPKMDTLEQLYGVVDVLISGWRSQQETP